MGAVSALGIGVEAHWRAVLEGRCGLGLASRFVSLGFPCPFVGEVKDLAAKDYVPKSYRKAVKVMARDTEIAVAAAKLAVDDAGFVTRGSETETPITYPPDRLSCHIGAGLIAAETQELASAMVTARRPEASLNAAGAGWDTRAWGTIEPAQAEAENGRGAMSGMGNLQPLWMLKYLPNMPACHVTIVHGAEGPSNTLTCGEASGLLCIGESARVIERGAADAGFAGSAESKIGLMGMARLAVMGRMATVDAASDPALAVRPYSPDSSGAVPGEGGGILMLESMEHAQGRKAKIYAEVAGFGSAQSGGLTLPPFVGVVGAERSPGVNDGLRCAILAALKDAGIGPGAIDAVIPQACGIPAFDAGEDGALKKIFGERSVPRILLAPLLGDCVAGNGGLQAGIGSMMVQCGRIPGSSGAGRCQTVLVCSSSQGGQNAALVLRAVA